MKPRTTLSMAVIIMTIVLSSPRFLAEFPARNEPLSGAAHNQIADRVATPEDGKTESASLTNAGISSSSLVEARFNEQVNQHGPLVVETSVAQIIPGEFFRNTKSLAPAKFELAVPKFVAGSTCKMSPEELEKSFNTSMNQYDLSLMSSIPESAGILDLNFYMEYRGKYYQLSLEPLSESLDKYQLTLIQSSSEDFTTDTERFVSGRLDPLQHYPSQDEAISELRRLIKEYSEQGARWGTRTALLTNKVENQGMSEASAKNSRVLRIELHDGKVRGFMNHQQECHLNIEGNLDCRCW